VTPAFSASTAAGHAVFLSTCIARGIGLPIFDGLAVKAFVCGGIAFGCEEKVDRLTCGIQRSIQIPVSAIKLVYRPHRPDSSCSSARDGRQRWYSSCINRTQLPNTAGIRSTPSPRPPPPDAPASQMYTPDCNTARSGPPARSGKSLGGKAPSGSYDRVLRLCGSARRIEITSKPNLAPRSGY
jgi:hypothetical protein